MFKESRGGVRPIKLLKSHFHVVLFEKSDVHLAGMFSVKQERAAKPQSKNTKQVCLITFLLLSQ